MKARTLLGAPTLAVVASLALSAAFTGGACGDSVPSDQGHGGTASSSSSSSSTTSSSSAVASSSSGGTGGTSTGDAGDAGTGGAPDCTPNPTTYVEIINACTNAQQVDVTPVLPLLDPDGGLPPLP